MRRDFLIESLRSYVVNNDSIQSTFTARDNELVWRQELVALRKVLGHEL